jgi:hypothetical protein
MKLLHAALLVLAVRPSSASHCPGLGTDCETCLNRLEQEACGYCSGQCIEAYDPTHVCAEDEVMITLSPNCAGYKYEPATPYFEAGHADYYKFWPDSEYITKSDRGAGEPYLLRIVYPANADPNTAVVPGGDITISETAAHAVAAEGDLDGELTLVQLHDIAATKYADEETPVWMVHSAKVHGDGEGHNLIFLYQWAGTFDPLTHRSGGAVTVNAQWSVGIIHATEGPIAYVHLPGAEAKTAYDGGRIVTLDENGVGTVHLPPSPPTPSPLSPPPTCACDVVNDTATIEDEDCRATCNALSAGLAIGGGALVAVVLVPVLCLLCILISVVVWCCVRKRRSLGNESATAA